MKHHPGIREYEAGATALAFPLGGIGTGNVSLGARGEWRDWEIFNLPAKGARLPLSFFAIRCEQAGAAAQVRVLEGPVQPPYIEFARLSSDERRRFAALQKQPFPRSVSLRVSHL